MPRYKNDPADDFDIEPNAEDNFYNSEPTQESLDYVKELEDKIRVVKKELKELHVAEENSYLRNKINCLINKIK